MNSMKFKELCRVAGHGRGTVPGMQQSAMAREAAGRCGIDIRGRAAFGADDLVVPREVAFRQLVFRSRHRW